MKYRVSKRGEDMATSHPARGAWIEIEYKEKKEYVKTVAPRKGCVD